MTRSSVHLRGVLCLALALVASLLLVTQWPDAEAAGKKHRVDCLGPIALVYEGGKFLTSEVVGSLGCEQIREAAK